MFGVYVTTPPDEIGPRFPNDGLAAIANVNGSLSASDPVSVISKAVFLSVTTDCGLAIGGVFTAFTVIVPSITVVVGV